MEQYDTLVCPFLSSVVKAPDDVSEFTIGKLKEVHCIGPRCAAFQITNTHVRSEHVYTCSLIPNSKMLASPN